MTPLKLLLNLVGLLALALGVAGLFLPLLPTTPFLLLASACFLHGSERLHRWMLRNPVFGKLIHDYEDKKAIPRRAKIMGIVLLWISMPVSIWLAPAVWHKWLLASIGAAVTVYLLRLRTLDPEE